MSIISVGSDHHSSPFVNPHPMFPTPSRPEKPMFYISLKTIPMILCFSVLVVTASIILGITSTTRDTMQTLLRDASGVDIDNMYVTASNNVQRINREWQESVTLSAKTFIVGVVNLSYSTLQTYKSEIEYWLRRVGKDGIPIGLTDTYQRDFIRRSYYDVSNKPASGLMLLLNVNGTKRQTLLILAPWTSTDASKVQDFVYIYGNGSLVKDGILTEEEASYLDPNDLLVEYCPIDAEGLCNRTFRRTVDTLLSNGNYLTQYYGEYPKYLNQFDVTSLTYWMLMLSPYYGEVLWQPLFEKEHVVTTNIVAPIRSPLVSSVPNTGDIIGLISIGIDLRSMSHYLETIVKLPGQRVFLVVKDALPFPGSDTVGALVAASHGDVVDLGGRYSGNNEYTLQAKILKAVNSTDTVIRALARAIESTPGSYRNFTASGAQRNNNTIVINGTKYFFSVTDVSTPEGIDWALVVAVPWEYSMGDIERNNAKTLTSIRDRDHEVNRMIEFSMIELYVTLGLSFVIILISAYFVTVAYTKPMLALHEDMKRVADMNLADLPVKPRVVVPDVMYHDDSWIPLHPMRFVTLQKLQEDNVFPQDLPFLPREMLELFDAMLKNCDPIKTPEMYTRLRSQLDPEMFFCRLKAPLVTQEGVKAYEAALIQEFMSWVEGAKTNDRVKRIVKGVFESLDCDVSFVLPRSNLRLLAAMCKAHDDVMGTDDPILDALQPRTFFRQLQEPSLDDVRLHQYLMLSYLLHWQRCHRVDNSSKHADLVGLVLKALEADSVDRLPHPLGDMVRDIRRDELPHYNPKTAVKRTANPNLLDQLPADLAALYTALNTSCPPTTANRYLDCLLPENYFGAGRHSITDKVHLGLYRQLLVAEWLRAGKPTPSSLPPTIETCANTMEATTLSTSLCGLGVDVGDETFLRLPLPKSGLPQPTSQDYVCKCLLELLVSMNTRDMLPAIVFNFDSSEVERLAFEVCKELEILEKDYRETDEFKKRIAANQEKILRNELAKKARESRLSAKTTGAARDAKKRLAQEELELEEVEIIPEVLAKYSFAKFGAGENSQKVDDLIKEYVKKPEDHKYLHCIKRGIGVHHSGMSSSMCSLMEHLYRTRNLGVIFSTTTLALGIHAPCRAVVLAGDDVQLTNVQFRQMAGRAGRRGLDLLGHVILLGIPARKISRLMTSKLQCLRGHSIVDPTVSLQSRMMQNAIMSSITQKKQLKPRDRKEYTDAFLDTTPTMIQDDIDRVHQCSFLSACYSQGGPAIDDTMRRLWQTRFIESYFVQEGYSSASAPPPGVRTSREQFVKMQTDMMVRAFHSYHNVRLNGVSNTFMALLSSGVLHEVAHEYVEKERATSLSSADDFTLNADMLTVLSYFLQIDEFGLPLEIHPSLVHPANDFESKRHSVALKPLGSVMHGWVAEELETYTERVLRQYSALLETVGADLSVDSWMTLPYTQVQVVAVRPGPAYVLPSSLPPTRVRVPFISLSGKGDTFGSVEDLVMSCSPLLQVDPSSIPAVDFIDVESRGKPNNQILVNTCAYDFLRVGCQRKLRDCNGLSFDETWGVMTRFRCSVDSMLFLSHSFAPNHHSISSVDGTPQDRYGNKYECCNPVCPYVRQDDKDRYHIRFIRGIVFKCVTCWTQKRDRKALFMCEGCVMNTNPKVYCSKNTPGANHEFAPYVEDDFVCCIEQVSKNLGKRRDELNMKEEAWVRKFSPFSQPQYLSEPGPPRSPE